MRLITNVKEGESIEKALKKYKKKIEKTRMLKELIDRKQYIKPSVVKRKKILKAKYREKILFYLNKD
ncbi:30S ribosomal protein S21 [Candidatus Shikimatogenerans silvanidophilus]|uniref:30S ribosomal protein S21 n=1 Tax=Candidatus Shikimatogenerans silvanidophilus TaxID=2782547 RepID=UPI001BA9A7E7|nr:30S ribosomal protein S21 [Candidatus Shikimatogenerans silvanidophilus]